MSSVFGQPLRRDGLLAYIGQLSQVAGVRLVSVGDGAGRGVRLLEFRSGAGLMFEVVVDRAFDLGMAAIDGVPFAWVSPVGIEGPWYREPQHLGWLRGFGGGLMVTGGLDHTLFPASDDASYLDYPAKPTVDYPLHGRISGEPATLVGYGEDWQGDRCILWAEGAVRQASVFGEAIELRRRIECEVGSNEIHITDVVTNHDFRPTPHMLLYHVNLGFPLIEEGARLVVDHESARPRGEFSMSEWQLFAGPKEGFVEEVIEISPTPNDDGQALATIVNSQNDLAVYERFNVGSLPYLLLWRMLGQGTYVVGLEPSTNSTTGRHEARMTGELLVLAPGESRRYKLTLGAVRGSEMVRDHLRDDRHRTTRRRANGSKNT